MRKRCAEVFEWFMDSRLGMSLFMVAAFLFWLSLVFVYILVFIPDGGRSFWGILLMSAIVVLGVSLVFGLQALGGGFKTSRRARGAKKERGLSDGTFYGGDDL